MLPTHTKQRNGGQPTAAKLQSAFDKGMTMAGLKGTKSGPGDKERAYIVRQNWALKTFLLLLVAFSVGTTLLFSTVLQVRVTKRDAARSERVHHELEHHAQVRLMKAHLELQKALETEIHETSRLEEFRSMSERELGDFALSATKLLQERSVDPAVVAEVEKLLDALRNNLDVQFDSFLQHFKRVAMNARNSLKRVAHAIVTDVELDKKEDDRFRAKMDNLGQHVPETEDPEAADEKAHNYDAYGVLDAQDDGQEAGDSDEKEIVHEVERFYAKLNAHDFPLLGAEVIAEWELDMQQIARTLEDDDKETDLSAIRDRVNGRMGLHAPSVAKFDPAVHSSIVDYFEMRIEEAKLAYHKQSLLDLYAGWKEDGKLSVYTLLSGIEHLAEENNMYMLFEWLDGTEGDEIETHADPVAAEVAQDAS